MGVPAVIATSTDDIRILVVVVNDGCVITVVFFMSFGQGDPPRIGFNFYIIADQ